MSRRDVLRANGLRFVARARELPTRDWYRPSLCVGWSNLDVLAHLVVGCSVPTPALVGHVVRHRGSFDRANDALTRHVAAGASPADLIDRHEQLAMRSEGIGRLFPRALLVGDHVLHELDILLALGLEPSIEPGVVVSVLNTEVSIPNPFVPARRTAKALRFTADDLDWTHGPDAGPSVQGPGWAIASVLANRPHALGLLRGPGVLLLAERLRAHGHLP